MIKIITLKVKSIKNEDMLMLIIIIIIIIIIIVNKNKSNKEYIQ